jgi:hypothetical protein
MTTADAPIRPPPPFFDIDDEAEDPDGGAESLEVQIEVQRPPQQPPQPQQQQQQHRHHRQEKEEQKGDRRYRGKPTMLCCYGVSAIRVVPPHLVQTTVEDIENTEDTLQHPHGEGDAEEEQDDEDMRAPLKIEFGENDRSKLEQELQETHVVLEQLRLMMEAHGLGAYLTPCVERGINSPATARTASDDDLFALGMKQVHVLELRHCLATFVASPVLLPSTLPEISLSATSDVNNLQRKMSFMLTSKADKCRKSANKAADKVRQQIWPNFAWTSCR